MAVKKDIAPEALIALTITLQTKNRRRYKHKVIIHH